MLAVDANLDCMIDRHLYGADRNVRPPAQLKTGALSLDAAARGGKTRRELARVGVN
jgi:hypothetical protein